MVLPFANPISFLTIVTNISSPVARTQHNVKKKTKKTEKQKTKKLRKILHTDFSKERGGSWAALGFMA